MNKIEIKKLIVGTKDKLIFEIDELTLYSGEYLLVEGKNGEGKTLFLKSLSGDIVFESDILVQGSIKINGVETINNYNQEQKRTDICFITQNNDLFTEKTVLDEFLLAFRLRLGLKTKNEVIELLLENKINEIAPEFYNNLNENPLKLSGGNQRLLTILIWILSSKESSIFLIDEPLNHLDIYNIKTVVELMDSIRLNNPNVIILMVSHFTDFFPFLNSKLFFSDKKISKLNNKK